MRTVRATLLSLGLLSLAAAVAPSAEAGCGCAKPPPRPAAVRPSVTYTGMPVTLFGGALKVGQKYTVTFTSASGTAASVGTTAVSRRDLADGVAKPQLVVSLPNLPLGPAKISVTGATAGGVIISIADSGFTVAPKPVVLAGEAGDVRVQKFQAAVGRDGIAYLSLDVSKVTKPLVFDTQALGLPLRFKSQDVSFYNVQGFLMQRLVTDGVDPIPGMFVVPAKNPLVDGDTLHYSRHEFATYFLQHQERQPHAVSASDPNWHLDGTPHVDHDRLIVAIGARTNTGAKLAAGTTPAFTLNTRTNTLFHRGLTGKSSVSLSSLAVIDSYTRGTLLFGSAGDVFTNGTLSMSSLSLINGSATASAFSITSLAKITGRMEKLNAPTTFLEVGVPAGVPDLGTIELNGGYRKITGPGSFRVSSVALRYGAQLFVDNAAGPVTLYVTGALSVGDDSRVDVASADPERFAVYVVNGQPITINAEGYFLGVLYAPGSPVRLSGKGAFFGAFVGDTVSLDSLARAHYDSSLRGN